MNVVNVVEYERVHVFVVECIHKLAGNRSRKIGSRFTFRAFTVINLLA